MGDPLRVFRETMEPAVGADEVARWLEATSRRAVRVDTSRTDIGETRRRLEALGLRCAPVPFAPDEALFVDDPLRDERPLGTLWEHQSGALYSQDAASMLAVMALDPGPGERVLDLCAAPGGKASHIAARMRHEGLLVANEPNPGRFRNMCNNMDRLACPSFVGTSRDGLQASWSLAFDRVLVDAPCTNLGGVHAGPRPAAAFTLDHARRLAGIQRALLAAAFDATREGGVIVYSTCTLEPEENEAVASWFLETHDVDLVPFDPGVGRPGLTHARGARYHDAVAGARRLHPGDAETDGFFVARFTKRSGTPQVAASGTGGEYEAAPGLLEELRGAYGFRADPLEGALAVRTAQRAFALRVPDVQEALGLRPTRVGCALAAWDAGDWRLAFDAATAFGRGAERTMELSEEHARLWLAGRDAPRSERRPFSIVTLDGEPLGCGRPFGARLPSFVPKERRVPLGGPERLGFLAVRTGS